jgi:hypothetical protein
MTVPLQRGIIGGVVLYAVRVILKESRLFLPELVSSPSVTCGQVVVEKIYVYYEIFQFVRRNWSRERVECGPCTPGMEQ